MQGISRRRLMGGALGAGAASGLPLLGTFARAGNAAPPTRLVILWTPNDAEWVDQYEAPLTAGAPLPDSLPNFLQPLAAYRDRLVVAGGLTNEFAGGHTSIGHALTGIDWIGPDGNSFWSGGPSVDQHIAQALGEQALTLGVSCGSKNGKGRMCYSAAETPVDPIEDPIVAFNALFSDIGVDDDVLAALRVRRHSVLDRVASDLQAFEAQIPAQQRPRLQQHLEAIRGIEATIDDELLAGCDPTMPAALDTDDNALVPQVLRAQMSILAQALGCGATRVATLQLSRAGGGTITPLWPEEGIDVGNNMHGVAHEHYLQPDNPAALADARAVEAWYSTQLAFLLEQLDSIPDVDGGTLLDNTLVVHAKELGRRHELNPLTYVMAGGPNVLDGDRYVSFNGRPHNDLLLTLCHKMGLADATFGDASVTTGPLAL
ncbi:MAG: DUF1552 domain-containing protein [Nannocystaceae bacterium]|nr:DUF1552 domain-containing protein [Nannocystaceae bacterium]